MNELIIASLLGLNSIFYPTAQVDKVEIKSETASEVAEPPSRTLEEVAHSKIIKAFGEDNWISFHKLVQKESGWKVGIVNKSSGACGLPQALPCSKLGNAYGNAEGELDWMITYIKDRYGDCDTAWQFHLKNNWY